MTLRRNDRPDRPASQRIEQDLLEHHAAELTRARLRHRPGRPAARSPVARRWSPRYAELELAEREAAITADLERRSAGAPRGGCGHRNV